MGCIYIIKNSVNNKVYIGQTSTDISIRMRAHRHSSKYKSGKLYEAMRTLGVDKFWIERLCYCSNSDLNEKEIEYIAKYDSFYNGYNSTLGGGVNHLNINDIYGDDIITLYKDGMTSGDIAKLIGCSDVTVLNVLESHGINRRNIKKEVVLIEKNKLFDSVVDAARFLNTELNLNEYNIWNLCNRITRRCKDGTLLYNYHFAYKQDIDNGKYAMNDTKINNIKKIPKISECNSSNGIKTKGINKTILKCSNCGKPITKQSKTGMCLSCATVQAKAPNKPMKPSKEELIQLLNIKVSKNEIARIYQRSPSTVRYWLDSYDL